MNLTEDNEQLAMAAFNRQSVSFDEQYSNDPIIQYKRKRVRDHVSQLLSGKNSILELNSGTGEDAIWFAEQGHRVHATDISEGMQQVLKNKVSASGLGEKISTEIISFTQLEHLKRKEKFEMVFSNFAGLNCTGELDKVLGSLPALLKPGGIVTLVILPKFCLWEFLLLFKGKFRTAFRRFFSSRGTKAHIESEYFRCWYYNPGYVISHLKNDFDLIAVEGLCTLVPPSYMEGFAENYPRLFSFLKKKEDKWKNSWPWKYTGDYYIISLKKK